MKDQFFASQRKRVAYKKVSAAFLMLSLNLSLGGVGAMLLGSQVAYAASGYAVSVTSATPSGLTLSLVGTTSAHPYVGSTGQQHVQVTSWGDSSALTDASTDLTFGGSGGSKFFDGTWSASHLYVAAGTYTITVKVCHQGCTGAEGSDFSTATTVVVIPPTDTTAPVIAFHADISAVEAASPAGAIVIYTAPATSDNVDPAGIAICSPASGSTFPLGQSIVTCNATDAAGNHASPTTFKVTVVDTTAPVIAAHSDVAAERYRP